MNRVFNDQELARREKLSKLKKLDHNPYQLERITFNTTIDDINRQYRLYSADAIADLNQKFQLIGRLTNLRLPFAVLSFEHCELQVYFPKANQALTKFLPCLDLGDFIQVSGELFVTKMNELTLKVNQLQVITKALKPLPDKHYGFKDQEQRLRKRYLDTIIHPEIIDTFKKRALIINTIRHFLNDQGYLEVETPILQPIIGGANARPFTTFHNSLKQNFYLRIATELALKKMVVGGLHRVYELGRCFRNEGIDATHNPEFTSLEIYTAFVGLEETINLTESLFHHIAKILNLSEIVWNNHKINLVQPFQKKTMAELVKAQTGFDFYQLPGVSLEQALALADQYHIQLLPHQKTVGHIFTLLFEHLCEHELIQPTFVVGYHRDVSPLAKSDKYNPEFTLRFELFMGGREVANGFAELNDPDEQLIRFEKQAAESCLGNLEASQIDYSFVEALDYGLVPTGGVGIGIDRLIMLFTGNNFIKQVIFFPTLKKI